ncbi:MAG: antitoxin [Vicinamibacteria bacterium]
MTAKVFIKGRNQAIRIPVQFRFDTDTVSLKRGDALIVRPVCETGWDAFFEDGSLVLPEDFETGVDPAPQERELD